MTTTSDEHREEALRGEVVREVTTCADCQRFADDGFTYETHFDEFCSDWVPR